MKILGLSLMGGLPIMHMLCVNYDNPRHENHIEIARRYWNVEPNKYKAIILVITDNDMTVYNQDNFRR